ncbi:hypothetical protein UA08_00832 [Talaromyces atroroseus]|uniref:Uncharacterized protein n=1 Tax=Talaromyces atroroseus TaxID=1441469 RepID=A0A225B489_TALAT|nr:hypothetical protein UA08_00832 [Talaromyces atroroseus]OKL64558.1 hypothetical protein UA08_00832 [Talaromyces atroroseus]
MDRRRDGSTRPEGVERERENDKEEAKEEYEEAHTEEGSEVHGITSHLAGSAGDILRPLSEVAAQRAILFPSSGSLALLATQHADRGQNQSFSINNGDNSLVHAQSDSNVGATVDALREFTAAVWQSSSESSSSSSSSRLYREQQQQHQQHQQQEQQEQHPQQHQQFAPSPFACVFPEGTSTSPLFLQRCDESETPPESDPEPSTVLKYSESMQLFRRSPEDGGKIWKRRVLEYR